MVGRKATSLILKRQFIRNLNFFYLRKLSRNADLPGMESVRILFKKTDCCLLDKEVGEGVKFTV
jgi:hypothetical protein